MELLCDEGWIYERMGGRLRRAGAAFTVWAPHATSVALIGDFNRWKAEPFKQLGEYWVTENLTAKEGDHYQFIVDGVEKADPFALANALRPDRASVLLPLPKNRLPLAHRPWEKAPVNIYELHLGSWKKKEGGGFPSYLELADRLAEYCTEMGFTHVELLPLNEHPLDQSWGYQVTGYYAVTSRYGLLGDFIAFVERLHKSNIGVIIDWVPGHFPKDSFGLAQFDGTPLFEGDEQVKWGTLKFDYAKPAVRNFLIGSALFWLQVCGVDGIRVDALASMLYKDFAQKCTDWQVEDLDAIAFIKELVGQVRAYCPGALLIAEDASRYPGVTKSLEEGGLGFDLKWNLGWTSDMLDYFSLSPLERDQHYSRLTFGMTYAFDERHALTLSHDDFSRQGRNVHTVFPKEDREKQLLLFYSYAMTQPGKKLFFMGTELGEVGPWCASRGLNWQRMGGFVHEKVRELNHFYLEHSALWERDFDWSGFEWIECDDIERGVLVFKRISNRESLICLHNFSSKSHKNFALERGTRLLFTTDLETKVKAGRIDLPPFASAILAVGAGLS